MHGLNNMEAELLQAYEACRHIHAKHGKSYYFATRFLPADVRLATYALYAFFRLPDEIVDNPTTQDPKKELERFRDRWRVRYELLKQGTGNGSRIGMDETEMVLWATADTFHRYHIPFEYSESFMEAMIQDTWKASYATYEELRSYMYGSAAVVGLMMCHVIGFEKEALPYAEKLGYAMQLTNFLRDIEEDKRLRGRTYLPQDELARFGSDKIGFMKFQIDRADRLYDEANHGIRFLHPRGRFAVRAASDLYREILRKIEARGYDVSVRVRTSLLEKILITMKSHIAV